MTEVHWEAMMLLEALVVQEWWDAMRQANKELVMTFEPERDIFLV